MMNSQHWCPCVLTLKGHQFSLSMTDLVFSTITIDWYIILTAQYSVPDSESPHQFHIKISVADYISFRK
jgi:hypothetical protein